MGDFVIFVGIIVIVVEVCLTLQLKRLIDMQEKLVSNAKGRKTRFISRSLL